MSQRTFHSLPDFGFTPAQVQTLQQRLRLPQFLYISGPAGGGKTKAAMLLAWTFFQAYRRPFRIDGQDMTTAQIRQAAIEKNAGILFHDMASAHDYIKAGYCADCHMTAIGLAFDGPASAPHAHAYLMALLPALTNRDNVTVLGIERDEESTEIERYKVDLHVG
jgi:hypothetical protein